MKVKLVSVLTLLALLCGLSYYYFNSQSYHHVIPVTFDSGKTPILSIEIEGKPYVVGLDLELEAPFVFYPEAMKGLKKRQHSVGGWRDYHDNCHECSSYIIREINLADITFENVLVTEIQKQENVLWEDEGDLPCPACGFLGKFFLRKFNVLLNFPEKKIVLSNDLAKLKKAGIYLDQMVKVPLTTGRRLTFAVETDFGIQNLALATVATINGINRSFIPPYEHLILQHGYPTVASQKLLLGGYDFGLNNFYCFDSCNGWLGMDFLEKHVIYIDYANKVLYIKKI